MQKLTVKPVQTRRRGKNLQNYNNNVKYWGSIHQAHFGRCRERADELFNNIHNILGKSDLGFQRQYCVVADESR